MAVLFFFFAENDYICGVFLPSYIETVRIRGLRYPLTVVRSGPHSGSPMKEKTGLTLIAVSSLFEKAEGAGMEIISFLSTR